MSAIMPASKEALIEILDNLHGERLASLLDYAEYLLRKQAQEDAVDIADSNVALKESANIPWDEVKREIDARVVSNGCCFQLAARGNSRRLLMCVPSSPQG